MEWASCTVERGFSNFNRIIMNIKLRLSKERLNNLLLLQINVPIFTTLDPNCESKLLEKIIDIYQNKQKRYHSTKSNANTSKSLSSVITEKEDLLLPTTLDLTDHTPASMLIENDSYLQLSDNDFEGNQSCDDDSGRNLSEDEIIIL